VIHCVHSFCLKIQATFIFINTVKYWPILIIFGMHYREET